MAAPASTPMLISSQLSNRLALTSCISAVLVVLIHCYVEPARGSIFWWFTRIVGGGEFGTGGLVRMAVPYFFVASGFLIAGHMGVRRWWLIEVQKRISSFLVPFFIWGGLFYVLILTHSLINGASLPDCLLAKAIGIKLGELPLLIPTWFLRSLFVLVVLTPLFAKLANPLGLITLSLFYAIHVILPSALPFFNNGIWHVTISTEGMFYFTLGMYFRHKPIRIAHTIPVLILSGVLSLLCLTLYAYFDYYPQQTFHCLLRTVFKFLAIPLCLTFIWLSVPELQLPAWARRCPFPIFLIHYIIIFSATRFLCLGDFSPWLHVGIAFALGLGGSILLMAAIMKFAPPPVVKIAFGGR